MFGFRCVRCGTYMVLNTRYYQWFWECPSCRRGVEFFYTDDINGLTHAPSYMGRFSDTQRRYERMWNNANQ